MPAADEPDQPAPLVSMILTTRDRPRFLDIALRCYAHQTYEPRELIVVDDGSRWPVSQDTVTALGGRLIRVEPGTPLGTKLNCGIAESTGMLCGKMDDDDWYGPGYLDCLVGAWRRGQRWVSWPAIVAHSPHAIFNLDRWETRFTHPGGVAGGTLLFARQVWEQRPFRAIVKAEDGWFILDQVRLGTRLVRVPADETFLLVRHGGVSGDRGHTWRYWYDQTVEKAFAVLPSHKSPERIFPAWALAAYKEIRGDQPRHSADDDSARSGRLGS